MKPTDADFRIAISAIWHETQVDRPHVFLTREMLDRNDSFFRGKMGQQRRGHYIADRIDTFLPRLLIFINLDETFFDFDLRAFETEPSV